MTTLFSQMQENLKYLWVNLKYLKRCMMMNTQGVVKGHEGDEFYPRKSYL